MTEHFFRKISILGLGSCVLVFRDSIRCPIALFTTDEILQLKAVLKEK